MNPTSHLLCSLESPFGALQVTAKRTRQSLPEISTISFEDSVAQLRTGRLVPLETNEVLLDGISELTAKINEDQSAFLSSRLESSVLEKMKTEEKLNAATGTEHPVAERNSSPIDNHDDELICVLSRDRRNLVLDSIRPFLTPHIVITPPKDSWNDFFISSLNHIDVQWSFFLSVPTQDAHLHPLSWMPSSGSESRCERIPKRHPEDYRYDGDGSYPMPVLKYNEFSNFVTSTSTERLIMAQVVATLQKRLCKIAAYTASERAASLCTRYRTSNYFANIEKPFRWSDPADPILVDASHQLGTIIIDSENPFTIPHIIITAPPPQDPWVLWANATNDPQDCGFGRYLTVPSAPSRNLKYVNYWSDGLADPEALPSPEESFADLPERDVTESEDSSDEEDSPPSTPAYDVTLDSFPHETGWYGLGVDVNLEFGQSTACDTPYFATKLPQEFAIDDDDDELPPFDDWYQTFANRSQTGV